MIIMILIIVTLQLVGLVALAVRVRAWMGDIVALTVDATADLLQRQDDKIQKRIQRSTNGPKSSVEEQLMAGQPLRRKP